MKIIETIVDYNLPQEDSVLYFWARPSMLYQFDYLLSLTLNLIGKCRSTYKGEYDDRSKRLLEVASVSTVFEPIKNDSLLPRERIAIDSSSFTQNSCSMTGYVYEMFDMSGNPLGWLPFDNTLSKAQFEYTVLTKEFYDVSVDNEQMNSSGDWVNLYPNPSSDNQNLVLFLQKGSKLSVNLYDMQGRLIKKVYQGKQNGGETNLNIDIASLSSGMYIYKIIAGDKAKSIQFIKQ